MNDFQIKEHYRDDDTFREAYFRFVSRVFSTADFREWYARGCWPGEYNPVSIVVGDEVVSNISLSRMSLLIDNRPVSGIQLGAVGTVKEYRGRGLSRLLMEYVMEKHADTADVLFLFGNDDVVDFYPRFGFEPHGESVFVRERAIPKSRFAGRRLDVVSSDDWALLSDRIARRSPLTRLFGAVSYDFVTLWHVLNLHPRHVWYVKEYDLVAIVSEREGVAHVWDLIFSEPVDIERALAAILPSDTISAVHYYFAPDVVAFEYDRLDDVPNSHLFVRGSFPLSGRDFKFPATAET